MNKVNDSFQMNCNLTDDSNSHQHYEPRVNQASNQKTNQSIHKANDIEANMKTIRQRNVLNDFKATLAETEKHTSILNSNNNSFNNGNGGKGRGKLNQIPFNCTYFNETIGDTSSIAQTEAIEEDDPFERLKVSNDVLLKANLDLRNTNKIMKDEIEAYKNSSVYQSPYSQYDINLNEFIANIKQALHTSQMSNQELQEIVAQAHKRSESLSKTNSDIVKHFQTVKEEFEAKTKEASELKVHLLNRDREIGTLNEIIQELNAKEKQLEGQIFDNEKQINFQLIVNASYNKYKEDSEEMMKSLKETIETLQKGSSAHMDRSALLQRQNEELQTQLKASESTIENLNNEITSRENDLNRHLELFEEMNRTIQQLKETIASKQNEIRQLNGAKENLSAQIESLDLFIEDREKTISTLKASLAILTKTFDNDINVIKGTSNESISIQMKLSDTIDQLNERIQSQEKVIEDRNRENNALRQECASFKREIDDCSVQFEENQYEYQLLYQKYKEQAGVIEALKVEFLNKRKDSELMDLIKANEDILKKLQRIQEESNAKTQEIADLKKNYSKLSRELFEAQKLNTALETQNNNGQRKKNILNHCMYSEINELEESATTNQEVVHSQGNQVKAQRAMTMGGDYFFYTIIDRNSVLSFNWQVKRFNKLAYNDKSGNFKKSFELSTSTLVNFLEGLFIVCKFIVFYFNPRDSSIKQVAKLSGSHISSNVIYINNELYIISGENTRQCEKVSFDDWKISQLPDVNSPRCNGGLCLVDSKYVYALFGECVPSLSTERLNLKQRNSIWEKVMLTSDIPLGFNMLSRFICYQNGNQIIIIGGVDERGSHNEILYQYDYKTEKIKQQGKSKCSGLFLSQLTQIEENLFVNCDIDGNIHMFNKQITAYELYKQSLSILK